MRSTVVCTQCGSLSMPCHCGPIYPNTGTYAVNDYTRGYEDGKRAATASAEAKYGALIHWPDCWDTMAYPTLESALREIGCNPEDCTKPAEEAFHLRHYYQCKNNSRAKEIRETDSAEAKYRPVIEKLVDHVKAAEELLFYDGYTSPQATAKSLLANSIAIAAPLLGEKK